MAIKEKCPKCGAKVREGKPWMGYRTWFIKHDPGCPMNKPEKSHE